jgi:putative tryptophan/tyrosine transport system substrate-binding protein
VRRREFITLVGGAAASWPVMARAQQPDKNARIGLLIISFTTPLSAAGLKLFTSELGRLGFVEGKNIGIERRELGFGALGNEKLFADAADLAQSNVDVLVAFGSEVFVQAAVAATKAIPTVILAINYDPIARGYVKSLARPGGNITGVTFRQPELASKQMELLKEAFPNRDRLAVLYDAESAEQFDMAETAAKSMQLRLDAVKLENPPYEFEPVFRTLAERGSRLILVLSSGLFTAHRARIAELAIRYGLPSMFTFRSYVDNGGLMSFGVDTGPAYARVADYVAKILKGAKPADLPVEQVTSFELVINLKTAKAIGVDFPTSILLRANTVIE